MALVVLTDSYLLLAAADTYLSEHYATTDAKMILWTALTDANCETYLRQAALAIDRLPLTGYKAVSTQTMAFPRAVYTEFASEILNPVSIIQDENWYIQPSVPDAVKNAQCEIAFQLAQGVSGRVDLQRQGVKSFSLGNLSESYSGKQNSIISYEAKQLLAPYMGGLRVC